jgi:hypothetical protein
MPRGLELQYTTRARVIETRQGEAQTFTFRVGPIACCCIVNLPASSRVGEEPLVYVKISLAPLEGWFTLKEHPNGD